MTQIAVAAGHRVGSTGYRRATGALLGAGLASFAAMYCTQALLSELSAYYRVAPATAAWLSRSVSRPRCSSGWKRLPSSSMTSLPYSG